MFASPSFFYGDGHFSASYVGLEEGKKQLEGQEFWLFFLLLLRF